MFHLGQSLVTYLCISHKTKIAMEAFGNNLVQNQPFFPSSSLLIFTLSRLNVNKCKRKRLYLALPVLTVCGNNKYGVGLVHAIQEQNMKITR